jgi:hypothetical protein
MSNPMITVCPACGAEASGKFCRTCGAGLGARVCSGCGAALAPGMLFCSRCGRAVASGQVTSAAERVKWMLIGGGIVGVVAVLLVLITRGSPPPVAAAGPPDAPFAAGADGPPPDISKMSPRERFDRLYNRIMTAAENGDDKTASTFTPMALAAYGMLDSVDADARYHAALIKLHTGDINGATALGDTILAKNPGHLFGYVVLGTVARFRKDDAGLNQAYRDFLAHYDSEMKAGRSEYGDHSRSLTEFKQAAEAARRPS